MDPGPNPPPPSRTDWTRLVPPPVLIGRVGRGGGAPRLHPALSWGCGPSVALAAPGQRARPRRAAAARHPARAAVVNGQWSNSGQTPQPARAVQRGAGCAARGAPSGRGASALRSPACKTVEPFSAGAAGATAAAPNSRRNAAAGTASEPAQRRRGRGARAPTSSSVFAPPPRTKWTRRVPHTVLSGHAASLTPY